MRIENVVLLLAGIFFMSSVVAKPNPETFLDSLCKSKEVALSDKNIVPILSEPAASTAADITAGKTEIPNGFRVQCFASSQIDRVRAEQKVLESKISDPVYIVVALPYYKLLVGDYIKRQDADAAILKLKDLGYADAWVIRSKVWNGH